MKSYLIICPTMAFADSRFREAEQVLQHYGIEQSSRSRRYIRTAINEFRFTNNDEINRRGARPESIKSMEWFDGYIYAMRKMEDMEDSQPEK